MRESFRRARQHLPQSALTAETSQRGVILQLLALQVMRYIQLIPPVLLLGVNIWFWRYLFRISCVQRAAPAVIASLLIGTLIGLVVGVRQGERPARSQLQRVMTMPEGASMADIFARSRRERLPTLLGVALGIGLVLVLVQMALWRVSRGFSDAMVLATFLLTQLLLSLVTALFYGSFHGSRWISVCLQHARQPLA